MDGIRVEVQIHAPDICPVVHAASQTGAPVTDVSWACVDADTVTEEFVLETDDGTVAADLAAASGAFEEVFNYNSKSAMRFERDPTEECPCDHIEAQGCPLMDVYAHNDQLVLVFHAPDIEHMQAVLRDLQECWSDVSVHRLIQSGEDRSAEDLVFVDRGRLTDRQVEVLETAQRLGYFEHPKGANASEVAAELGITQATFSEHLASAQRKLLTNIIQA